MLLKVGSKGDDVVKFQRKLNKYIEPKLVADGIFGNDTKKNVAAFQKAYGLPVDGIAGPQVFSKLNSLSKAIGKLTQDVLIKATGMGATTANTLHEPLMAALREFEINTPLRMSAFMANVCHECGSFSKMYENLNYSAERLAVVWPKRYSVKGKPNALALEISRKPEAIANHTYADRMGNGNVASGDGWTYRGRGPLMVTGKDSYALASDELGVDFLTNPDLMAGFKEGCRAAAHYWQVNNINRYADSGRFDACCDLINLGRITTKVGDSNGYTERLRMYDRFKKLLGA